MAAAIMVAVERNEAVVPVGAEARFGRATTRFTPGLTRRLASVEMPGMKQQKKERRAPSVRR